MAFLDEQSSWVENVYLIAKTDPLMGGENGVNNVQARQLAWRTRYLKDLYSVQHSPTHLLGTDDLSATAAIAESKLALSKTTGELKAADTLINTKLDTYGDQMNSLVGAEGSSLGNVYKAIGFAWHYGYERYDFEMFSPSFTMQEKTVSIPIVDHVGYDPTVWRGSNLGDESIDVQSTTDINVGDCLIFDTGVDEEKDIVFVTDVLTNNRIRIDHDNPTTVTNTGVLTNSQWEKNSFGWAHAPKNGSYITDFSNLVENYASGKFVICYVNESADFDVKYRIYGTNVWVDSYLIEKGHSGVAGYDTRAYYIPPAVVSVMVTALEETDVDHMVLFPTEEEGIISRVRTPRIKDKLKVERFGGLYDDTYLSTQVMISQDSTLTTNTDWLTLSHTGTLTDPWWDMYSEFSALSTRSNWVRGNGKTYYWKARHTDKYGNSSLWSTVASFTE